MFDKYLWKDVNTFDSFCLGNQSDHRKLSVEWQNEFTYVTSTQWSLSSVFSPGERHKIYIDGL